MLQSESDSKSCLIKQICDIYSDHAISSSDFIDWYILLQVSLLLLQFLVYFSVSFCNSSCFIGSFGWVEDNVGVDIIRKKYHKYALLLHPDKNKHPKAEFAFKLVSEAYACLSDDAKRSEFDIRRWNNLCSECVKTPQTKSKVKGPSPSNRSRSKKISAKVKEVKARLMEEARVIEKCLKAKANANATVFDKETPVFDPDNYATDQGYPHFPVYGSNEPKSSRSWLKKRFKYKNEQQQQQPMKVKCDSPVFECRSNRSSIKL